MRRAQIQNNLQGRRFQEATMPMKKKAAKKTAKKKAKK
jgi:hypothetical protein